ncbi:hypothetical protein OL229_17545 [Neisseriaceae bacterium JH1-16]|nr:hypothetical protein [Neisseriaceae bacterium JH1-16]
MHYRARGALGRGHFDLSGGDSCSAKLAGFDGLALATLAEAPVHYATGRCDKRMEAPVETRYL